VNYRELTGFDRNFQEFHQRRISVNIIPKISIIDNLVQESYPNGL